MQTPEGAIKKKVRIKLRAIGAYVYSPVPMGMGMPTLDDLCCIGGRFVAIEYKAPGNYPTPRQRKTMDDIRRAGGIAIWGDSVESVCEELTKATGIEILAYCVDMHAGNQVEQRNNDVEQHDRDYNNDN